jgi:uncharacterized membrane protein YfhO
VYASELVDNASTRIDRLLDPSFDVRNIALTETPTALPENPALPASRAEIVQYGNNHVVVKAVAQADGLLVLADQYFTGWEATVDGEPAAVLRVNHVMRGVLLNAGQHTVTFTFAPRLLWIGSSLSILGLALCGVLVLANRRRPTK